MSVVLCESYIRFELPPGSRHHEDVNPDHNTGVDLEIASQPPIWLEVKNWNAPAIPPEHRYVSQLDALDKTKSTSEFWDAMVAKFEGTYECLETRQEIPTQVIIGLLLKADFLSNMAVAPMISVFEQKIAASKLSGHPFFLITDASALEIWVSDASATGCQVALQPRPVCAKPVLRCSVDRRAHLPKTAR